MAERGEPSPYFFRLAALALGIVVLSSLGAALVGQSRSHAPADPSANASSDYAVLARRELGMPVPGIKASDLHDTYRERRGSGRTHEALDIAARRGDPVVAVDDGEVAKLFDSKAGGLTVYQFDRDRAYCYYYAHLDRYAEGLRDGMWLQRGTVIGYVGSSGNAPPAAPHLHFAIFKLGPDRRWWHGTPIDPYPLLTRSAPQPELGAG